MKSYKDVVLTAVTQTRDAFGCVTDTVLKRDPHILAVFSADEDDKEKDACQILTGARKKGQT